MILGVAIETPCTSATVWCACFSSGLFTSFFSEKVHAIYFSETRVTQSVGSIAVWRKEKEKPSSDR